MRGNPPSLSPAFPTIRSIPAYAGEPMRCRPAALAGAVYPRVCGGTDARRGMGRDAEGLSPRMRGNLNRVLPQSAGNGSIPAYAGEPAMRSLPTSNLRVYPRVCGGTTNRRLI